MNGSDDRMSALRQRFVERCQGDAAELRNYRDLDRDALIEIVHRLSGSAGIFGFARLSEAAEEAENALRDGQPYDENIAALLAELEAIQLV